ncbi:MAG: alpha amylase N-terminal ig-like domain-containing protein [Treponema sp.]|nr:alpha amylase N-terminal ig-like domain-containing protein [Treponema sp.]
MDFSAVAHYAFDNYCYSLDKDNLAINIRTGKDIVRDGMFNHTGRDFFAWQNVLKRCERSQYALCFQRIKRHRVSDDRVMIPPFYSVVLTKNT